ncbi:hypothetical protein [Crossiella sp. NPDC003009]
MIIYDIGAKSVQVELAHTGGDWQRAAVAAWVSRWRRQQWPEDLLGVACLPSVDGASVLTWSQWATDAEPWSLWGLDGPPGYSSGPRTYHRLGRVGARSASPGFFGFTRLGNLGQARDWLDALPARPKAVAGELYFREDGRAFLGLSGWREPVADGFRVHTALSAPVSVGDRS